MKLIVIAAVSSRGVPAVYVAFISADKVDRHLIG